MHESDNAPSPLAGEGRPQAGERGYNSLSLARAKALRQNQTEHERKLWQHLRGKRFAGFKFRRQQPMDHYIVDFVCHQQQLIIELDGGQHGEDRVVIHDEKRTEYLERSGYQLLRFWNHEIMRQLPDVLDRIDYALTTPLPAAARRPSPARGEGKL